MINAAVFCRNTDDIINKYNIDLLDIRELVSYGYYIKALPSSYALFSQGEGIEINGKKYMLDKYGKIQNILELRVMCHNIEVNNILDNIV